MNEYSEYDDSDELDDDGFDDSRITEEKLLEEAEKLKLILPEVDELRKKILDVRDEKNKVVRSQRFEEAASLRDTEKRLIEELDKAVKLFYFASPAPPVTLPHKLCFRIIEGKLEVFIVQSDGTTFYSDGTKMEHQLLFITQSKWNKLLSELEKLINKPDLKEQDLQNFFEENPELILQDDYDQAIPQATIVSDGGYAWEADFVLVPQDQLSFAKILELKLPKESLSLKRKSGHSNYSAKLHKAIGQLKDYYEAFNSEKTKDLFSSKYKVQLFKPDLQLFMGRRKEIGNSDDFLNFQKFANVIIKDWDSVLADLKKKFK